MHSRSKLVCRVSHSLAALPFAAILIIGSSVNAQEQSAPAPRTRAAKAKQPEPDKFLQGPPFKLYDVLRVLEAIQAKSFREGRFIEAIRARGVDFTFDPEVVKVLKGGGASDQVLAEIRIKAKAPAAPAAPPKPPGAIAVSCLPAECTVSVNGGPPRPTKNGQLVLADLPEGKIVVDINREGYIGAQHIVPVAGNRVPLNVKLEPSPDTQLRFGSALAEAMMKALGVSRDLKDYGNITGTGTTTTTDGAGATAEWNIEFRLQPPDLSQLQAANPSGSLTLTCRGEQCTTKTGGSRLPFGGKRLKAEDSTRLADNLHRFRRNQIREVLERVLAKGVTYRAAAPPGSSAEQLLECRAGQERYEVTLGADNLPSLVVFHSQTSPTSGSKYMFADYTAAGETKYPKRTEVRMADSRQGIAVRFEKIEAGSGLREKDFPR